MMTAQRPFPEMGDEATETMTREQLVEVQVRYLEKYNVIAQASGSRLYAKKWKDAGIRPSDVRSRESLRKLPFITRTDIIEAMEQDRAGTVCSDTVYAWFSEKTAEKLLWVPFGARDLTHLGAMLNRMARVVGMTSKDIVLVVGLSAPYLSDALPYLFANAQMKHTDLKTEFISVSEDLLGGLNRLDFCLKRQPTMLFLKPSTARAVSSKFLEPSKIIKRQKKDATAPKEVLTKLKRGLFYGEPLGPHREALAEQYGDIELCEVYAQTEAFACHTECRTHAGVHIWQDACIAEIIPEEERERMKRNPTYMPKTTFLLDAAPETVGELVITTFGEALPLVRYRTGDIVEVASTGKCACGRTHPRVNILRHETA